jgi:hypothetical protein
VNQTFPETLVGYYYAGAAHAYAEDASLRQQCDAQLFYVQLSRLDESSRDERQHLQALERWHAMQLDAATRYASAIAQFKGQPLDAALVASRMAPFLQQLESDPVWRRAHR